MATYKTPGVYVEEISLFPPSVAGVETALPAFLGLTEKAQDKIPNDLRNKAVRISSFPDYINLYGGAPGVNLAEVIVDPLNNYSLVRASTSGGRLCTYDSVQLYFANGGGDCYILSIGSYSTTLDKSLFYAGLDALELVDEPTLILFPDAASLDEVNLGLVQQAALAQCHKLGDRFCVFDTTLADAAGTTLNSPALQFRNDVGMNYLNYGAVYAPWINPSSSSAVTYASVAAALKDTANGSISLKATTTSSTIQGIIDNLEDSGHDKVTIDAIYPSLLGTYLSLSARYAAALTAVNALVGTSDVTAAKAAFHVVTDYLYLMGSTLEALSHTTTPKPLSSAGTAAVQAAMDRVKAQLQTVIGLELMLNANHSTYTLSTFPTTNPTVGQTLSASSYWADTFGSGNSALALSSGSLLPASFTVGGTSISYSATGTDAVNNYIYAANYLGSKNIPTNTFQALIDLQNDTSLNPENLSAVYEKQLLSLYPYYKQLVTDINSIIGEMPPSGAVVGRYAAIDHDRGVWKAPANTSLSGVISVTHTYKASDLENLNIDVNAGKSVNVIRPIQGEGIMIMGARTLAGNDNEWRYINVRRFFIFVEESVKKATQWVIFEPNDAGTWVKVQAEIENFLYDQWNDGALVGAKSSDAYFVNVGLGKTMTAQDILNGYLIVEIGMAVARPAEFIVLKFSHKLQVS